MSFSDFAASSEKVDLLTCSEKSSVYYFIATGDHGNKTLMFDWNKRGLETFVSRFHYYHPNQNWSCDSSDTIQFAVNKDVVITGFGTYTTFSAIYAEPIAQLEVFQHNYFIDEHKTAQSPPVSTKLGESSLVFSSYQERKSGDIIKIQLTESLFATTGLFYSVKLNVTNYGNGRCVSFGGYGISNMYSNRNSLHVQGNGDLTFSFYSYPGSSTTPHIGQIPRIYYLQ